MCARRGGVATLAAAVVLALGACGRDTVPPPPPATSASPASAPPTERVVGPLSEADAKALATMNDRLKQYVELHVKLEQTLPKLPKEATPQQIDKNQRALEKLMRETRTKAKPGDFFTAEAQRSSSVCLRPFSAGPTASS